VPLYPLHRVGDRHETQTQLRKADRLTASVSFHHTVAICSCQPSVFATQCEDVIFCLQLQKLAPETLIHWFGGRHTAATLLVGTARSRHSAVYYLHIDAKRRIIILQSTHNSTSAGFMLLPTCSVRPLKRLFRYREPARLDVGYLHACLRTTWTPDCNFIGRLDHSARILLLVMLQKTSMSPARCCISPDALKLSRPPCIVVRSGSAVYANDCSEIDSRSQYRASQHRCEITFASSTNDCPEQRQLSGRTLDQNIDAC
jgi:hypothetical protein